MPKSIVKKYKLKKSNKLKKKSKNTKNTKKYRKNKNKNRKKTLLLGGSDAEKNNKILTGFFEKMPSRAREYIENFMSYNYGGYNKPIGVVVFDFDLTLMKHHWYHRINQVIKDNYNVEQVSIGVTNG